MKYCTWLVGHLSHFITVYGNNESFPRASLRRINWRLSSSKLLCLAYPQARAEASAVSFAAHMLHRERVQPLTDEEKAAGAKLISAWVMSAPRAAARAYCKAVDAITGGHKHYTPAELLFNVANISILAHIDLSTASLSISQLS